MSSASQCSQQQCCLLPTPPGGYPDDALEDALQGLGCDLPAAYSESGGSRWWLYVQCPATWDLVRVVERYAGAPYHARFSFSACLASTLRPGDLIVEFDPTCDSCILE